MGQSEGKTSEQCVNYDKVAGFGEGIDVRLKYSERLVCWVTAQTVLAWKSDLKSAMIINMIM